MKKKLFDIVISVETEGKTVTADICCQKDGKNFTQDALEGDNLRLACESLRQANFNSIKVRLKLATGKLLNSLG